MRVSERSCPFCGVHLRAPASFPPVAALVVAVGSVLTGCGPAQSDSGDSATDSSTSTGASTTATPTSSSSVTATPPATTVDSSTTGELTSTTEDSREDTSSTDESTDLVGGFYGVPGDFGNVEPQCDIYTQDCPRDERCVPFANDGGVEPNTTRCSPVAGNASAVGAPCTQEGGPFSGFDDCELGAVCYPANSETLEGTCVALCSGTQDDPTCDSGTCVHAFGGALPLCLSACDPLAPETCDDTEGCFLVDDAFQCIATGPAIAAGDPCVELNDCADNGLCIAASFFDACAGENCCAALCDTEASSCTKPLSCLPVFEDQSGPGVCLVPKP